MARPKITQVACDCGAVYRLKQKHDDSKIKKIIMSKDSKLDMGDGLNWVEVQCADGHCVLLFDYCEVVVEA